MNCTTRLKLLVLFTKTSLLKAIIINAFFLSVIIIHFQFLRESQPIKKRIEDICYCNFIYPFVSKETTVKDSYQEFIKENNIEQKIIELYPDEISNRKSKYDDWHIYTLKPGIRKSNIKISIVPDRQKIIFYPRLKNTNNSIAVYELIYSYDNYKKKLFYIKGSPGKWSSIGTPYEINLRCRDSIKRVVLEIALYGEFTQIWYKGSEIFF